MAVVKTVNLNTSPILKINVHGQELEFELKCIDSVDGYKQNNELMKLILDGAVQMNEGKKQPKDMLDNLKMWIRMAIGNDGYNQIFINDEMKNNYTWHEQIFMAGYMAITESKNNMVDSMIESPVLNRLKSDIMKTSMNLASEMKKEYDNESSNNN